MVIKMKINSHKDLEFLRTLAAQTDEDVFLHSGDESVMLDVKSFLNLFAMDFSEPVSVVTESPFIIHSLTK